MTVVGRFQIADGFSNSVSSTIGVKQGCPLSPTLFGLYIDDLEDFLLLHTYTDDSCLLYHIQIVILLFVDLTLPKGPPETAGPSCPFL